MCSSRWCAASVRRPSRCDARSAPSTAPIMNTRRTIMRRDTITAPTAAADMTTTDALPLFTWLSPGFPVGAYAYSHGVEWAVETGDIRDEATLLTWLSDALEHGAGRNDAILLAHASRALGDNNALAAVNELALALAPSQELRLETAQQGRSFLDAVLAAWPQND